NKISFKSKQFWIIFTKINSVIFTILGFIFAFLSIQNIESDLKKILDNYDSVKSKVENLLALESDNSEISTPKPILVFFMLDNFKLTTINDPKINKNFFERDNLEFFRTQTGGTARTMAALRRFFVGINPTNYQMNSNAI
ncbi:MAG: hypothetical protein MHPSP_004575, partial [Paramarteilia canceri]